mmetsp:Transcript_7083/g.15617  ORF Transcript_7083/g.15617 Transcript_7083/m.15617 type:complete len:241 (+) Transcript_7083:3627-4349(+)
MMFFFSSFTMMFPMATSIEYSSAEVNASRCEGFCKIRLYQFLTRCCSLYSTIAKPSFKGSEEEVCCLRSRTIQSSSSDSGASLSWSCSSFPAPPSTASPFVLSPCISDVIKSCASSRRHSNAKASPPKNTASPHFSGPAFCLSLAGDDFIDSSRSMVANSSPRSPSCSSLRTATNSNALRAKIMAGFHPRMRVFNATVCPRISEIPTATLCSSKMIHWSNSFFRPSIPAGKRTRYSHCEI